MRRFVEGTDRGQSAPPLNAVEDGIGEDISDRVTTRSRSRINSILPMLVLQRGLSRGKNWPAFESLRLVWL